ncbi:MAG: transglycosylase SLT domain-containing protein [Hydrogenovibrio sp.]
MITRLFKLTVTLFIASSLVACSSNPPKETHDNICQIFDHDPDWAEAARDSAKRWGTPEYILMAFVHQESRFTHDAQPPRDYALGLIPLPRRSSAYGYPQAQDPAWYDYQKATGNWSAKRTNVDDSLDFIGWYNYQSYKRNGISRHDPYNLYLAYHEGHGGYSRRTFDQKKWLKKVAYKVTKRATLYKKQLQNCKRYAATQGTKPAQKSPTAPKRKPGCNAPWPYC